MRVAVTMMAVVLVIMRVIMIVVIGRMIVPMVRRGLVSGLGREAGESRGFIGEREERIALGTGKPAATLFAGKERGEPAGQKQTEEDGDRYDGHAWNACPEYRLIFAR